MQSRYDIVEDLFGLFLFPEKAGTVHLQASRKTPDIRAEILGFIFDLFGEKPPPQIRKGVPKRQGRQARRQRDQDLPRTRPDKLTKECPTDRCPQEISPHADLLKAVPLVAGQTPYFPET